MPETLQEILVPRRESPFSPNNFPALLGLKPKTIILESLERQKGSTTLWPAEQIGHMGG